MWFFKLYKKGLTEKLQIKKSANLIIFNAERNCKDLQRNPIFCTKVHIVRELSRVSVHPLGVDSYIFFLCIMVFSNNPWLFLRKQWWICTSLIMYIALQCYMYFEFWENLLEDQNQCLYSTDNLNYGTNGRFRGWYM